jgi:hypothetical protein
VRLDLGSLVGRQHAQDELWQKLADGCAHRRHQ